MHMCSNGHSGAEAPVQSPALAFSSSIPFSRSTAPRWEPLEHATPVGSLVPAAWRRTNRAVLPRGGGSNYRVTARVSTLWEGNPSRRQAKSRFGDHHHGVGPPPSAEQDPPTVEHVVE